MAILWAWQGALTDTSVKITAKVTGTSARVYYDTTPDLSLSSPQSATISADATGVVPNIPLTGLQPDTRYWWAPYDGTTTLEEEFRGSFRTAPAAAGERASFEIAVGTCAGGIPEYPGLPGTILGTDRVSNHPVFDTIRQRSPLLFVHQGDMAYYDPGSGVFVPNASVSTYRQFYDSVHFQPRQSALYRSAPTVYTWDDHDYGPDNSDGTFVSKANPAQVYRERVPSYTLAEGAGSIYHSFQIGRILFVASDTRYNRSPNGNTDNASKTMLGAAQKTWLDGLLASSTAEALVWLMPTPWLGFASDTWASFTTERAELVTMLGDHGWLDRMVMFNGDYHGLAMDRGSNPHGGFPIYVIGSMDSPPQDGGIPTFQYDAGATSPGNNRWGSLTVRDHGHRIELVGACNIGALPWRVNVQTITTSTPIVAAFPATQAPWRVEIAPGGDPGDPSTWQWVDITGYVRLSGGIELGFGRADEWSQTGTTTASLTLDNRDGRFSPRNPDGPWFGLLGLNTPIRIRWDDLEDRFVGFVSAWPPRWNKPGTDGTVPITAAGVLRRLAQGEKPLLSALRRSLTSAALVRTPLAYWPCEDATGSQWAATTLPTGREMRLFLGPGFSVGSVTPDPASRFSFSTETNVAGTAGVLSMPFGWFGSGEVRQEAGDSWSIEYWQQQSEPGMNCFRVDVFAPGDDTTPTDYSLSIDGSGGTFIAYNDDGEFLKLHAFIQGDIADFPQPHYVVFNVWDIGSNFAYEIWVNGVLVREGETTDGRGFSMPYAVKVQATDSTKTSDSKVCHVAVWNGVLAKNEIQGRYAAGSGYVGEHAADRIARLCLEERVPYFPVSGGADTMPLGAQGVKTLTQLLREAEAADGGILHEAHGGLSYLARDDRYNLPVTLTVDATGGELAEAPEPTDDDQQLRNDVMVSRDGGSAGRVVDAASVAKVGTYDVSDTVNVQDDEVLDDIAGWTVRLGTVDAMRWPSIALRFEAAPQLIPAWLAFGINGRLRVPHDLPGVPGDPIEVNVAGWSERLLPFEWTAELNTTPYAPWVVGVLEDDVLGRVDTDGAELAEAIDADDTTFLVDSLPDAPEWTTNPADFPFDVNVGGETMTVTGIVPGFNDTFTRSVVDGWGNATTGQAWTTSGGAAANFDVLLNSFGQISLTPVGTRHFTQAAVSLADVDITAQLTSSVIATGGSIALGLTARVVDNNNHYLCQVLYLTSGMVQLQMYKRIASAYTQLATTSSIVPYSAGGKLNVRFQVIGNQLRAKIWTPATPTDFEPEAWRITATDTTYTAAGPVGTHSALISGNTNPLPVAVQYDNYLVRTPQRFTVVRSSSPSSHAAGTDVRLAQPLILSL